MARDPGLQPERTALAWSRTALAVLVNALLLLRAGMVGEHRVRVGIGGVLLLAAGLVQGFAALRRRRLQSNGIGCRFIAIPGALVMATAGLTAVCSVGSLLAILGMLGG